MKGIRVLFVDDEPNIIRTMPAILRMHGFEVTAVATVNEALAQVTSAQFEVLISDLNIGEPGDGFVVVGAMRRTQPSCVTIILTGFPGIEAALEGIRSQVDDFLVKPAPIPALLQLIEQKLKNPRPGKTSANKRLSRILLENQSEITERALKEMKSDALLGTLPLTDEQRIEYVPLAVGELATMLESAEPEKVADSVMPGSEERAKRYRQSYTIPMIATSVRLLQRAIYDVIQEKLLSLNLSFLMLDLKRLNDILGLQLEYMLKACLDAQERPTRRTGLQFNFRNRDTSA
jgi:ActR/RegA family two-component response regulator